MTLDKFIIQNNVDKTSNLISLDFLNDVEKILNISFGQELKEYILNYGYLSYSYIELYGINSKQECNSDLVKQTLYLHKYFPKTIDYVAIEGLGEGEYYLVDTNDIVYLFDSEQDRLSSTKQKLFDYIYSRFTSI